MKKKLLMCYHSAEFGGIEQQISDIIKGLSKDIDVYVACPNGPLINEYLSLGAAKHFDLYPKSEFDFGYVSETIKLIKKYRIDIVHAHELRTGTFAMLAAFIAGCPKRIYHVHTSFLEWKHSPLKKFLSFIPNFTANFITGNILATQVLALTNELKKTRINRELISESKIVVIPNGVNLKNLEFSLTGREEIRKRYNIDLGAFVVGNISRFTEEKGHDLLIKAFKKLHEPATLLLAGSGKLLAECKELATGSKVIFTDKFPQEDKQKILSAIDLYALPTLAEGFGISLVEGLANGKAVLSSDIPVMKEVGGDAAEYFMRGDEEDLLNKMRELIKNHERRNELQAKALDRSKMYSLENFWNNYKKLYLG